MATWWQRSAPRQSAAVKEAFGSAARGLLKLVERRLHPRSQDKLHDDTLKLTAQMVGAVVLARMVEDKELARRLLENARKR